MLKKLSTVCALLIAFLVPFALQSGTANALASCSYEQCNGMDPNQTVCASGAYTLDSFSQNNILFELRYSATCHAAWARATGAGRGACNGWTDDDAAQIDGSTNESSIAISYPRCIDWANGQAWTLMIGFHYWVRACHMDAPSDLSGESWSYLGCTAWH